MGVVGRYLGKRAAERTSKEFQQEYWNWATQYFRLKVDGGMVPPEALLDAHFTAYTRTWNVLTTRGAVPKPWQAPHAFDSAAGMEAFAALAVWSQVDPDAVSAALDKQERNGGASWESIRAHDFIPTTAGLAGPPVEPPPRIPDSEATRVGTEQRQRATGLFWGGAAVFVAAALSAMAATDGGVIWTGGLLVGALLIWKSIGAYQRSTALGIPGLHVGGWVTVAFTAVVCLAVGGTAGVRYLEAEEVASQVNDVGSCWKVDGEMVELTGCSGDVDFVATDEVKDPKECPMSTESYVNGRRGHYLCLGSPVP